MNETKTIASLSLDLDNLWSYLKTHGESDWQSLPSYFDTLMPRVLEFLAARDLRVTVFVVGQDAAIEENRPALTSIVAAGHEIGNHSFQHEPWLHRYTRQEIDHEIGKAEEAIVGATGCRPTAFRGPGYSLSAQVISVLVDRGYRCDASTFPSLLGPLARAYYLRSTRLSREEREERRLLFGRWQDGLRPLRGYRWVGNGSELIEVPVTTMPILRTPIHFSYLIYMAQYSKMLAKLYFGAALRLCRLRRVEPSLLLHPLDFLGSDDTDRLSFFPAMRRESRWKLDLVGRFVDMLSRRFEVLPIGDHAEVMDRREGLPEHTPRDLDLPD